MVEYTARRGSCQFRGADAQNDREVSAVNACALSASVTALANVLAGSLSGEEVGLLGAILTQLGDSLTTIAAHRALCGQ